MARVHTSRTHASRVLAIFAALLLVVTQISSASAADDSSVVADGNESTSLWFVELASEPTVEGTSVAVVQNEKKAFRDAARRAGLDYSERFAFDTLWNGLSIELKGSSVAQLSRVAGVKAVWPVATLALPASDASQPDLATALAMTGADAAQSELGLSGAGIKVAIMDTGVDYHHPDLGGCFALPGCRVTVGHDFVGDAFNADPTSAAYNPVAIPDSDPDDCNGHGTHVAGIVGAAGDPSTGGARGVAPGVTFGAYRVFGCAGSTTADIMIRAMEMAFADGMNVLNMSIGSAFQWPQYPTATASDRLVNRGMVVVASIGNSGASGLYSASAPGLGKHVIGVASFDNSHVDLRMFTISPDGKAIGYQPATAAPAPPTAGTFPMARTGAPTTGNDACAALAPGSLAGKIALIRRGTCTFHAKALNAQNAGAAGVVLYNNSLGHFGATVTGSPAITIPVVTISDVDGKVINDRLALGAVQMTWTDQSGTFANPTGGLISSFSSYGLAPTLDVKPDIGAPGGLIRSTWPLELGGYATISGTSMASPHVAGGVALLLEARPGTSAKDVRGILQNSADPKRWWSDPSTGALDNVHRQGAGMIDIDDAILATTSVSPSKLALGESEAGPATRTLTISNTSTDAVEYALGHAPALSTGSNTFTPSFTTGYATATFAVAGLPASSVTVPAGGSATVDVTITANAALADRSQYGGYVTLTSAGSTYRVPYAGFKGDYQSINALTPTANNFPWLARRTATGYRRQSNGAVFTFTGATQTPNILIHLDHQVSRIEAEVRDASGKSWHKAFILEYVGRNSTATSFFALPWDGTTIKNAKDNAPVRVPNGTGYTITLTVLKALGDPANPAHVQTWTSPSFEIARP